MMMGSFLGLMTGGFIFISKHKHLLVMLISLEMMALSLVWMLGMWLSNNIGEDFFILVFLSMAACEGSMGLAVLICLVRSHGSDNFNNINVLEC